MLLRCSAADADGRRGRPRPARARPRAAARPRPSRPRARHPRPADPLSERELEVLRLLDSELTGPEIARELFVSLNTLRTHTKRIFTKLDVTEPPRPCAAPASSGCSRTPG